MQLDHAGSVMTWNDGAKLLQINRSSRCRHRSARRARAGLSLVELLVVIAIIAILAAILVTVFSKTLKLVRSWRSDAGHLTAVPERLSCDTGVPPLRAI
jgi:prepilin-type N-terminal cleavage/methylation domain-containing protein